ncbi:hypothetical protein FQA39_LY12881 [Lamprigera yunnana]|nr:hypothetical protein FQA39_LY12881 [Lamprigera yunnana]
MRIKPLNAIGDGTLKAEKLIKTTKYMIHQEEDVLENDTDQTQSLKTNGFSRKYTETLTHTVMKFVVNTIKTDTQTSTMDSTITSPEQTIVVHHIQKEKFNILLEEQWKKIFLKDKLIISCQAVDDEPLNDAYVIAKMAVACVEGGAEILRMSQYNHIKRQKNILMSPIIDATLRKRPNGMSLEDLFKEIKNKFPNQLLMADCSNIDDVNFAIKLGFDYISTTLRGYTKETKNKTNIENDFGFLKEIKGMSEVVFANLPLAFCVAVTITFTKESGSAAFMSIIRYLY